MQVDLQKKKGAKESIDTFKARLIAKGYTQIQGVGYKETFLLVAMIKSIRILLAIVAFHDYEKWHMDVKTIFFKGMLEEDKVTSRRLHYSR